MYYHVKMCGQSLMVTGVTLIVLHVKITPYGSTLYIIGMDEVLAHYACTFENSGFTLSLSVIIHF